MVKKIANKVSGLNSRPEVRKLFSYSTQLSMTSIMLINVKMPTNVGILILLSMIDTISESFLFLISFIILV